MKHLCLLLLFFSTSLFTQALTFGGPLNDHGRNIIRTNDNGYALLCQYGDVSNDLYFIKLDASANLQWTKQIGNAGDDYTGDLFQTADSGYVLIGTTADGLGSLHGWLLRLNSSGDTIWTKTFGNDPNTIYQGVFAELYDPAQFTIGIINADFTGGSELYLMRADTSGIITDTLCTTQYGQSVIRSLNDYVITGIANALSPDATIIALFDSSGLNIFNSLFFDVNQVKDISGYSTTSCGNGFLTAGSTNLYSTSTNLTEFYLLRTDAAGDSLWSKHWGDSMSVLTFIVNNGHDEFFASGYTESSGIRDNFIMKIDSMGDTLWTKNIGHELRVNEIMVTNYGFAIVGDSINSTTTDIWFMQYDSLGNGIDSTITGINNFTNENEIKLFPNPASNSITLSVENANPNAKVIIENFSGQIVYSGKMNTNKMKIDVSYFSTGQYFLKIINGDKISSRQFIKE